MEFEDVTKRMEWEARRVAAAFGVENVFSWRRGNLAYFAGDCAGARINWQFNVDTGELVRLEQGNFAEGVVNFNPIVAGVDPEEGANVQLLARGFYRLGLDEEAALARLPSLSAHEKMELRLSMPREFWPKMWIDEER